MKTKMKSIKPIGFFSSMDHSRSSLAIVPVSERRDLAGEMDAPMRDMRRVTHARRVTRRFRVRNACNAAS